MDLVVDYNSPTCVQEIRDFAGGPPEYAWNCIGSSESIEICELAMGGKGREKIASIIDVEGQNWTLGYDAFGETFVWRGGQVRHGDPEERAFATRFLGIANEMLAEGKIKPIRRTVNWGGSGLEGVIKGMDQVKTGLVSAEKLVYTF